jgi:hypothetical protein
MRNAEMRRKTSTPPDTRPSQTWYATTRPRATARSPWISGLNFRWGRELASVGLAAVARLVGVTVWNS